MTDGVPSAAMEWLLGLAGASKPAASATPWYVSLFVSAVAGMAGGVLTNLLTRQRDREKAFVETLQDFMKRQEDFADALALLQLRDYEYDGDEENRIKRIGDWFDLFCLLYDENRIDRRLAVESGLLKQGAVYLRDVRDSADKNKNPELERALLAWKWLARHTGGKV